MAFWDNLSQKASETTQKTIQKAREIQEVSRLQNASKEEEARIKRAYQEIGEQYVALHPSDFEPAFEGMVNTVREAEDKIRGYGEEILKIRGAVKCEKCGAEVQAGSLFCNSCGAPIPETAAGPEDDGMDACPKCGARVSKGSRFCTSCGSPMETADQPAGTDGEDGIPETADAGIEEPRIRKCPGCGSEVAEDAVFCMSCGARL